MISANHNQKRRGHKTHRDVLESALNSNDPLTKLKLVHNKKELGLGRDDQLLYDFEPTLKKPANVTDYDESKHKSMEPEQALEVYKALTEEHKDFVKMLHSGGFIVGLRSLTYAKTVNKEWPEKENDLFDNSVK